MDDREYEKTVQHFEDYFKKNGVTNISKVFFAYQIGPDEKLGSYLAEKQHLLFLTLKASRKNASKYVVC